MPKSVKNVNLCCKIKQKENKRLKQCHFNEINLNRGDRGVRGIIIRLKTHTNV